MSDTIQVKMFDPGRAEQAESWLVEDLLPEKTVTILASRPKSGKTVFTTARNLVFATPLHPAVSPQPVSLTTPIADFRAGDRVRIERERLMAEFLDESLIAVAKAENPANAVTLVQFEDQTTNDVV